MERYRPFQLAEFFQQRAQKCLPWGQPSRLCLLHLFRLNQLDLPLIPTSDSKCLNMCDNPIILPQNKRKTTILPLRIVQYVLQASGISNFPMIQQLVCFATCADSRTIFVLCIKVPYQGWVSMRVTHLLVSANANALRLFLGMTSGIPVSIRNKFFKFYFLLHNFCVAILNLTLCALINFVEKLML